MKRILALTVLILGMTVVARASTFTPTNTNTPVPTATFTPTFTPVANIQTSDVNEYDVVNASANGVTETALASGYTHYRIAIDPVDYTPSLTKNYKINYIRKSQSVEIHVTDQAGLKVRLSNAPITFSFVTLRKNYDPTN